MENGVKENLRGVGSVTPQTFLLSFSVMPFEGNDRERYHEGLEPQAPNPVSYLAPHSSVTEITIMIASRNGTSLIRRQNFSVPADSPR